MGDEEAGVRGRVSSTGNLAPSEAVAVADYFRAEVEAEHPQGGDRKSSRKIAALKPADVRDVLARRVGMSG